MSSSDPQPILMRRPTERKRISFDYLAAPEKEPETKRHSPKKQDSAQPLLYPMYPHPKLQGVGRDCRSIHVSETFIEKTRMERFAAHRLDISETANGESKEAQGGFGGIQGVVGNQDRTRRSSDHSFVSMTSASTASPTTVATIDSNSSGMPEVAGVKKVVRSAFQRVSAGNMDTTTPPQAYNVGCEVVSMEETIPGLGREKGEIVEQNGKLIVVPSIESAVVPPHRRGNRLPPIPSQLEFEDDSDDDAMAEIEEVESFSSAKFVRAPMVNTARAAPPPPPTTTTTTTTTTRPVHRRRGRAVVRRHTTPAATQNAAQAPAHIRRNSASNCLADRKGSGPSGRRRTKSGASAIPAQRMETVMERMG